MALENYTTSKNWYECNVSSNLKGKRQVLNEKMSACRFWHQINRLNGLTSAFGKKWTVFSSSFLQSFRDLKLIFKFINDCDDTLINWCSYFWLFVDITFRTEKCTHILHVFFRHRVPCSIIESDSVFWMV